MPDETCQTQAVQNDTEAKIKNESEVNSPHHELESTNKTETKEVQEEEIDKSLADETSGLTAEKSNGHVNEDDCSQDVDKNENEKELCSESPKSSPKKVADTNDNNESTKETSKQTTLKEDDKCSSSTTPTTSIQKENVSNVAKAVDKGNDQDPSNPKKEIVSSSSVSTNATSQDNVTRSINDDSRVEIKNKNEGSAETTNSNKSSEKGKPQKSSSCGSECQNQLNDRGRQKRTSDVSNECEGAVVSGTRRSAAEPHSSSLPKNTSKTPSAAAAKLNTLEILTAKHLNDGSKFEIFKGLIEVGKMTNKEVVNAVLYLVRNKKIILMLSVKK